MSITEELREALLNLEEARKMEAQQRLTAEALLAGLQALVTTEEAEKLFPALFAILRRPMDFHGAFVLTAGEEGSFFPIATSDALFATTIWEAGALFKRTLAGHPAAIFDTAMVEEWTRQEETIRKASRSALIFSIRTQARRALFVCTHPERAHFSRDHIALARRFSLLMTQAMMKLEADSRVASLEERLETEIRLAELNRKLADSEKKLARAQKLEALGLLAGSVAHDLNNILSGIVSYPDLLLLQPDLSQKNRRALETIRASGLRAAAVVQDLLTVARGVAVAKDTVQLNAILRNFLAGPEYRELLENRDYVNVRSHLDDGLLNIRASRVHVEKALYNLFSNALDVVPTGSDARIIMTTENRYVDQPLKRYENILAGEYVVLTVSDNGPGISEGDMERIFEPFYAKKKMGRNGTGLGLTIVWNTMHDHNGYVDVETGPGGTRFSLYFPVTRELATDQEVRLPGEQYRGDGRKILVVDDQEDQRQIARTMLTALGYEAEAVASGEEAVAYLKDHPVALVVLDMIMDPGINGRETYERITRLYPGQKAIITSGYSLSDEVRAAQRLGAGAFIKKPYRMEELGLAVRNELAKRLP